MNSDLLMKNFEIILLLVVIPKKYIEYRVANCNVDVWGTECLVYRGVLISVAQINGIQSTFDTKWSPRS